MNLLSQLFGGLRSAVQWWVVLAPWEAGLRVRKGRKVTPLGPGIHFRIPLLDRVFVQSTRYRISDMPIQTVTTADGQSITLKGQIGYRIRDIGQLYDSVHAAEATIVSTVQAEISSYIATHESGACTPELVRDAVNVAAAPRLESFGLSGCDVTMTDFARVETYRLITQDIWTPESPRLNTTVEHIAGATS